MKKTWMMFATVALAAAGSVPALAQWTGKGEAGIAVASGNTDTKSANAKIAIGNKQDQWEHSASLAGNYVRTDGDTTAKRWELGLQTRYSFSGATFWYGGLRYEEDRFSGFDHQGVLSTGVGLRLKAGRHASLGVDVALPLRDGGGTDKGHPRVHASATVEF